MKIKMKPQIENEDGLKMFCCTMETQFPMIIMAKDRESAEQIATENAEEEHRNLTWANQFSVAYTNIVTSEDNVPEGWLKGNPYYEDCHDEREVGQIIDSWQERQKRK